MSCRSHADTAVRPPRPRRSAHPGVRTRTHGTVLVVGLVILMVISVLALSGMRTSVLQELMAGHAKDANTAFQAAEGALQAGLTYLAGKRGAPPSPKGPGDSITGTGVQVWSACRVADLDSATETNPLERLDPCRTPKAVIEAWRAYDKGGSVANLRGQTIGVAAGSNLRNVGTTEQPRYIIETRYIPSDDQLETRARRKGFHYSTVTAVGFDANTRSRSILQTTITQQY